MYFCIKHHQLNSKDMIRFSWVIKWMRRRYSHSITWYNNHDTLYGSFRVSDFNPFVGSSQCEIPRDPLMFYQGLRITEDSLFINKIRFYVGTASADQISILKLLALKFPTIFILTR